MILLAANFDKCNKKPAHFFHEIKIIIIFGDLRFYFRKQEIKEGAIGGVFL